MIFPSWMHICLQESSYRITEWPGLKRTTMIIEFQPPCYVQGRQSPDQAAQSHIQPGLECILVRASTASLAACSSASPPSVWINELEIFMLTSEFLVDTHYSIGVFFFFFFGFYRRTKFWVCTSSSVEKRYNMRGLLCGIKWSECEGLQACNGCVHTSLKSHTAYVAFAFNLRVAEGKANINHLFLL